ncbi:hypothetical protein, partial [Klebsiella pneumoniae]|uniref:hypothetical protein n=1 Tax=Klebsiella pneumoniae TaxID=573 RepID=UPI0019552719
LLLHIQQTTPGKLNPLPVLLTIPDKLTFSIRFCLQHFEFKIFSKWDAFTGQQRFSSISDHHSS